MPTCGVCDKVLSECRCPLGYNRHLSQLTVAEQRAIDWVACMQWLDQAAIPRGHDELVSGDRKEYSLFERLLLFKETCD